MPFEWTTAVELPVPESEDDDVGEPDGDRRDDQLASLVQATMEQLAEQEGQIDGVRRRHQTNEQNREDSSSRRFDRGSVRAKKSDRHEEDALEGGHDGPRTWYQAIGKHEVEGQRADNGRASS